jgi:hypothetical protein
VEHTTAIAQLEIVTRLSIGTTPCVQLIYDIFLEHLPCDSVVRTDVITPLLCVTYVV